MTVPVEIPYKELAWTGVELAFNPQFTAGAVDEVIVRYRDALGVVTTLTDGVHVLVSLGAGNAVSVAPLAMPAAPGTVLIARATAREQGVDFETLEDFDPSVHQAVADAAARRDAEHDYALTLRLALETAALAYWDAGAKRIGNLLAATANTDAVTLAQLNAGLAAFASGIAGPAGNNLFTALTESIKVADHAVLAGERGTWLIANKATAIEFDLPAIATLATYVYFFGNINDGPLTLDGGGANIWTPETGDAASVILDKGDIAIVVGNGTIWRAIVIRAEGRLAGETVLTAAATIDVGASKTERIRMDGNTGIASLGSQPRKRRLIRYTGTPTITRSANLETLTGADRVVVAGALQEVASDDAGAYREIAYEPGGGTKEALNLAFAGEPTTRLFKNAAGDVRLHVLGLEIIKFLNAAGVLSAAITGKLDVSGDVGLNAAISQGGYATAVVAAGANDYALPANASMVMLTCAADRVLTGLLAPATRRRVWIWNGNAIGGAAITVTEEDVLSAAANRIAAGDAQDIVLNPGKGAEFIYDLASARWRVAREVDIAATEDFWENVLGKLLSVDTYWDAQEIIPLAFGATVTPDLNAGKNFELGITNAITSNFILGAPTNAKSGQEFFIRIKQGATPRTITFNAAYKFPGGALPLLTTIAARFDELHCKVVDTVGPVVSAALRKDVR